MLAGTHSETCGFCSKLARITSAHISLAKASHMIKPDAEQGSIFFLQGDTRSHIAIAQNEKSPYEEGGSKFLEPIIQSPSLPQVI